MKMRVLGCHGGELPKHRTTCFLVDGTLAIDAGALTSTLCLEELRRIDHILISHSHLDHVKDLPLFADLLVGHRERPVVVHASRACARTLRQSVFNNELWPDFTCIPSQSNPVLEIREFRFNESFQAGRYRITPVPVSHPVESSGFVIWDGKVSLGMSGDTGPTEALWNALNAAPNLKALLLETSFPDELQELADSSGHLTPRRVRQELAKFKPQGACRLLFYHLKPVYVAPLKKELSELGVNGKVLELEDELEL